MNEQQIEIVDRDASPIEHLERVFRLYSTRPCLAGRDCKKGYETFTYRQVWQRVVSLAGKLKARGLSPGEAVLICGRGGLEWLVWDLASLYLGVVTVPLATNISEEEFVDVLKVAQPVCVVADDEVLTRFKAHLGTLPSVVLNRPDEIARFFAGCGETLTEPYRPSSLDEMYTIVFSSGTTGPPRGIVRSHSNLSSFINKTLAGLGAASLTRVTVSYLPLCHMAGRSELLKTLVMGGLTYFTADGGLQSLTEDLCQARPTFLLVVPRLGKFLFRLFREEFQRLGGRPGSVREMLRQPEGGAAIGKISDKVLGGRLSEVKTGSARTPPEVMEFLRHGLQVQVTDVYASTELGGIATNGKINPWVSYRLVSRPELGYSTSDLPYPRGELAVRSSRAARGIFQAKGLETVSPDGEYRLTGDIVEERGPGEIQWLERVAGVAKLGNGKFVNLGNLEESYQVASDWIRQVFLYAVPGQEYLLGVLVPRRTSMTGVELKRRLRAEMIRVARAQGFSAYQIPRDFLVEQNPFTAEDRLLTETGKLRRRQLALRYKNELEALSSRLESRRERPAGQGCPIFSAVAHVLGLDLLELPPEARLEELGGDSLAALEASHWLEREFQLSVSASDFSRLPLKELQARRDPKESREIQGGEEPALCLDKFFAPLPRPQERFGRDILLTGCRGFLGRTLCLELASRLAPNQHLVCLVRAENSDQAKTRWLEAYGDNNLRAMALRAWESGRIKLLAGDFSRPDLGLSPCEYRDVSHRVGKVLHAGAEVNHLLSYQDLFDSNVKGTAHLLRFCLEGSSKAFHYVSTLAVAKSENLDGRKDIGYADGYLRSKSASEALIEDFYRKSGLPIAVYRCGFLLPHSVYRREMNRGDLFCRLFSSILASGLAPRSFYEQQAYPYDGLPVDFVAAFLAESLLMPRDGRKLIQMSVSDWASAPSLDQILSWMEELRSLDRYPYDQFYRRLEEALLGLGNPVQRQSALPLLDYWSRPRKTRRIREGKSFYREMERLGLLAKTPALDKSYYQAVFAVLEEQAFNTSR